VTISRHPKGGPTKREKVSAHIEELVRIIRTAHPEARFEIAPVPESRWPGLWVYANFEDLWDIFDLVGDEQDEFMGKELSGVHVIPMELTSNGA